MNEVRLVGNCGKDAESGTTGGGMKWARVSIATNERYKDGNEWKDRAEWHNVVAAAKPAERLAQLQKGQTVFIAGKIRTRKYQKDGVDHSITEIVAGLIYPIERPQQASGSSGASAPPPPEDDIPF